VNIFSRVRESGLRDEHAAMRVAHGDAMVARETRSECAKKKHALFNHPCGSNNFFVVKACTPVHMRVRKSKNFQFENKRRVVSDQLGHGESESGPQST
jgi:hypothetical protein